MFKLKKTFKLTPKQTCFDLFIGRFPCNKYVTSLYFLHRKKIGGYFSTFYLTDYLLVIWQTTEPNGNFLGQVLDIKITQPDVLVHRTFLCTKFAVFKGSITEISFFIKKLISKYRFSFSVTDNGHVDNLRPIRNQCHIVFTLKLRFLSYRQSSIITLVDAN